MMILKLILLTTVVGVATKVLAAEVKVSNPKEEKINVAKKNNGEGFFRDEAGIETIEEALVSAYKFNPELAAAVAQLNQANEGIVQAKAGYRPTVSASASVGGQEQINYGDSKRRGLTSTVGQTSSPTATGTVQVEQNFYKGGATTAQLKSSENAVKAARARLLGVEQNIFFQVVQSYLDILTKMAELEQYEGNLDLLNKTLEASKDKFSVGEETRTSVAQSEAQLAEGIAQLETARAELDGLKATFLRLTGRMPRKVIKLRLMSDLPKTLEQAIQVATQNNPNIIQAKFEETSARYKVDVAGAGYLPSLDFKANTSYQQSKNRTEYAGGINARTDDRSTNVSGALTLTIPIFTGGNVGSQKRQAHEQAAEKRINIETARRQINENLIQFWKNYVAAKANMENFKRQVEANKVSLAGTQEEMKVGTKILLDVLNAQKLLLTSQLNLVRAERSYLLESYRIMAMMGCLTAKHMKLKVAYYDPQQDYNRVKDAVF